MFFLAVKSIISKIESIASPMKRSLTLPLWLILGNTFLTLAAITFDIIFVSTLTRDIGRQFSRGVRFSLLYSSRVITACFC